MLRDMRKLEVGQGAHKTGRRKREIFGGQPGATRMRALWETNKLQFSTTSMNNSFLRYLMPSLRQLMAPVA